MHRTRGLSIVMGLVLAAVATSCSGSGQGAGGEAQTGTVVFPSSTSTTSTIPAEAQLPKGTVWAGAPDPCALVGAAEVRNVTRFDLDVEPREGQSPSGAPAPVCLFKNHTSNIQGGSVTITVLPPGTNFGLDQANMTDVSEIPGVGVKAYAGAYRGNPMGGKGITTAVVDMGNGGFTVGAFVHADLNAGEVPELARVIARNWPPRP